MSYSSTILAEASLVSYYHLNETSGTTLADSKGSTPLTLAGGFTFSQIGLAYDTSILFDGSTGKATATTSPIAGTTSKSIECWFDVTTLTQVNQQILFNGYAGSNGWGFGINGNGINNGHYWTLYGGIAFFDTGISATLGVHYGVMTMSSSGIPKLYIDGSLIYTGSSGAATPTNFCVAANNISGHFFSGRVDEVALYSSELTSTQVSAHYNANVSDAFSLTGPSSAIIGLVSSNFTITPNGISYTGTITPSDSGAGGTFTPTSLTWSGTVTAQTFTYTAISAGTVTISASASPSLTAPTSLSVICSLAGGRSSKNTSDASFNFGTTNTLSGASTAGWAFWINVSVWSSTYQILWQKNDGSSGWQFRRDDGSGNGNGDRIQVVHPAVGTNPDLYIPVGALAGAGWVHIATFLDPSSNSLGYRNGVTGTTVVIPNSGMISNTANNNTIKIPNTTVSVSQLCLFRNPTRAQFDTIATNLAAGRHPLAQAIQPSFYASLNSLTSIETDSQGGLTATMSGNSIQIAGPNIDIYIPPTIIQYPIRRRRRNPNFYL